MTADNENKRKGPFGTIWETWPVQMDAALQGILVVVRPVKHNS